MKIAGDGEDAALAHVERDGGFASEGGLEVDALIEGAVDREFARVEDLGLVFAGVAGEFDGAFEDGAADVLECFDFAKRYVPRTFGGYEAFGEEVWRGGGSPRIADFVSGCAEDFEIGVAIFEYKEFADGGFLFVIQDFFVFGFVELPFFLDAN